MLSASFNDIDDEHVEVKMMLVNISCMKQSDPSCSRKNIVMMLLDPGTLNSWCLPGGRVVVADH
jgi:hypothetical protein